MTISKAARIAALLAGGSAVFSALPVAAEQATRSQPAGQAQTQAQAQGQQQAAPERRYNLSRAEQAAVAPLLEAVRAAGAAGAAANWTAAQALVAPAQAAARGNDARYLVARAQLAIAAGTNDIDQQDQVIATLLANAATPAEEQAVFRRQLNSNQNVRAERAFTAGDFATAERITRQLIQANPGDQRLANNLVIIQQRMGNSSGAIDGLLQQIRTAEAASQRADETLYRRARDLAYQARNMAQARDLALQLARHYPTAANWRDAVEMNRAIGQTSPALNLDLFRLSRAAGALQGEGDYVRYAQLVDQAGLSAETRAVLDAGIAARAVSATGQGVPAMIQKADRGIAEDRAGLEAEVRNARAGAQANPARAAGDALFGYGRYAEAADLYRAALTKTGADANLLNLRLGTALALAGRRAEAETALRAAGGPAGDVAKLWLAWLAGRQG